jgi:4-amino-4-deoxy-L-arabinose transferase-like glycosyltransferase
MTEAATREADQRRVPAARGWPVIGIAMGAIALVYVATRLSFIDRFPYFSDEGTFALLSWKASRSTDDLFISMTIGHPPLHSWLGIPFIKLGFNPLIAMRLVSATAGAATVVVVGLLGRRLGGARVGVVAAALCVLLPFFVVHHGIGIIEPLVVALMVSALYLQYELARKPDLRVALLLGLVLAAAWITKENTKPALVLLPLSLLCFDWSRSGRRERLRTWLVGIAIVALLVVAAQLLLESSSLYSRLQATRASPFYTVRSVHEVLTDPFGSWGPTWSAFRPAFVEYISIPLLAAAAGGAVLAWRRDRRLVLLLLAWIAVPFLVSMSFSTFPFPRHIMYIVPPMIVLMAYGIVGGTSRIVEALPPRAGLAIAGLAVLLLLLPALRLDWRVLAHPATAKYPGKDDEQYVTGTGGGSPWPGVRDELRRRARGPQVVVLHPNANPERVQLLLGPDPRYVFPRGSDPLARRAQFAITDKADQPFVDEQALAQMRELGMRPIARFPRPRGGVVVTLYGR